jgi:hypothetical protein
MTTAFIASARDSFGAGARKQKLSGPVGVRGGAGARMQMMSGPARRKKVVYESGSHDIDIRIEEREDNENKTECAVVETHHQLCRGMLETRRMTSM